LKSTYSAVISFSGYFEAIKDTHGTFRQTSKS